ncbi:MAG: LysM peptidoglycan-binding domain-containing protein [Intrasporangiaceae bacterium]|nr:LysM peptidoglycan-binding domain-containing protein [Intrasporangiaceae bacterium]
MLFSVVCMHSSPPSPRASRFVLVIAGVVAGIIGAVCALATVLRASLVAVLGPGRTSLEELIMALSSATALLLLLWVCLALLAAVLSTLPSGIGRLATEVRDRLAPAAVRRWAGLLLGVTVAGGLAPGAAAASWMATPTAVEALPAEVAAPAPAPSWSVAPSAHRTSQQEDLVEPAPAPEWTPAPVREQPRVSLTAQRTEAAQHPTSPVTVRRGDTLWDLAAAHLPPGATDAEIATEWQRWHAANRAVIGPDPDLILPGQILTIPGTMDTTLTGGEP